MNILFKPCPFCNGEARYYGPDGINSTLVTHRIECRLCGARVLAGSKKDVINKWERRVHA